MSFSLKWSDQVSILCICMSSGFYHIVHQLTFFKWFEHDTMCINLDHITLNFENISGHIDMFDFVNFDGLT